MGMPLVSILIPTYNRPVYFKQALMSAITQSYQNIEIIISDDSTNDEVQKIAWRYCKKFPNRIKYYKNKINKGGRLNFQSAFERANGEYINYLMDDDLFHPHKVEKMMHYFMKDEEQKITLVTSYRQPIGANGEPLADFPFTKKRFDRDTIVDGIEASNSIILESNWIGEPTTPLFRKKDLIEPFGHFCRSQYYSAVDMASWLSLLARGDLVYIADTLSYLRLHDSNIGKDARLKVKSAYDWIHILFHSPKYKVLEQSKDVLQSMKDYLCFIDDLYLFFPNQISDEQQQILNYYKYCVQTYQKNTICRMIKRSL